MKIELRKLKHATNLSEETNAFTADIYIDGALVGTAENDGQGGNTSYGPAHSEIVPTRDRNRKLIADAEAFCRKLPPYKSIPMGLEMFIDDLVSADLAKKSVERGLKTLERASLKNIVIISKKNLDDFGAGRGGNLSYRIMGFQIPTEILRKHVDRAKAKLEGDEFIFNTNINLITGQTDLVRYVSSSTNI